MRLRVPLPRKKFEDREIYVRPEFNEWLQGPLRRATAFYEGDSAPAKQALALFQDFISGEAFNVGRNFKRMRPIERDVFELTTPDLRVFGWFPTRRVFVAVAGDFMVNVKNHDLYPGYCETVVQFRQGLDLDEPKWQPGATEDDVL